MDREEGATDENWCHQAVSRSSFADAICAEKFCYRKNITTARDPEIIQIEKRFENRRRYKLDLIHLNSSHLYERNSSKTKNHHFYNMIIYISWNQRVKI